MMGDATAWGVWTPTSRALRGGFFGGEEPFVDVEEKSGHKFYIKTAQRQESFLLGDFFRPNSPAGLPTNMCIPT